MQRFKHNGRTNRIVYKTISIFLHLKRRGWKCNALHNEEILKNDVILIVLNNDEIEDATSLSEEDNTEMLVMTKRDIQELKINEQCIECVHIQLY